MGAEIKRDLFGRGFFHAEDKLKNYTIFLVFAFIYAIFIILILPRIEGQQTRLLLLGITYLFYIIAFALVIISYYKKMPGKQNISKRAGSQSKSESYVPRYILEYIAREEYVSIIDELFKPKDLDYIKINLQKKTVNEKELIDKAFLEYSQAISLDPLDHSAHNNIGNIYLYKNMADEAIKEYLESIRLKPGSYRTYSNLGIACFLTKKYDEAIVVLKESLKLKPDYATAHNNLGVVLLEKQLFDDAIEEFQAALKTSPDNAETRQNLELCMAMKKADMYESISGSFP